MDFKLILEFTKTLDVLYVEYDEILRENNQLLFNTLFSNIDVTPDTKEAFEMYQKYFQENQKYYDLVITDIDMPHINGLELSKKIYSLNKDQSIIITAENKSEHLLSAIEMGISSFLLKPLDIKKMSKVFYQVCQNIYYRNFVLLEYPKIEEQNIRLIAENSRLNDKIKNLEHKSIKNIIATESKDESTDLVTNNDGHDYFMNQVAELVTRDLHELVELHSEMDKILVDILMSEFEDDILEYNIPLLSECFKSYSSILSFYTFFDNLSVNMSTFSQVLNIKFLVKDREQYSNIFTLLESFLFVLSSWQNELATCDHSKIDYYNSSIINDMITIGNMWSMKSVEKEEMEFF